MLQEYDEDLLEKLKLAELNILKDYIKVCDKYNINYFLVYGTAIGAVRHNGFIPWDDDIDVGMLREDYDKFVEVVEQELGQDYILTTPLTMKGYASTVIKLQRKNTKFVPQMSRTMKCDLCIHIDIFIYDNFDDDEKIALKKIRQTRRISQITFLCGSPYPIIEIGGIKQVMAKVLCFMAHYVLKILFISPQRLYKKFEAISTSANNQQTKYMTSYEDTWPLKDKLTREDLFPLKEMKFEDIYVKLPNQYDKLLRATYGDYMQLPPENQRVNHAAEIVDFGDGSILKKR